MIQPNRKVLTVKQPWARLILMGQKTIEVRSRPTRYRGPLLIHASGTIDTNAPKDLWTDAHPTYPDLHHPRGALVAEVQLVGCRQFERLDAEAACVEWRPGLWAWLIEGARAVYPPLHTKGRLGIWNLSPEDASQLVDPLEAHQ